MSAGIVDTRRLAELEETIERGLATFIEVGTALAEVRDSRLYRAEHDTFEDYCRKRWQMDRVAAHRHIEAANVVAVLSKDNIEPPANLRQARELAPLRDDEAELVETWRELRAEHGQTLTASKIRHAVEMRLRTEALAARRPEHAVVPSFDGGTLPDHLRRSAMAIQWHLGVARGREPLPDDGAGGHLRPGGAGRQGRRPFPLVDGIDAARGVRGDRRVGFHVPDAVRLGEGQVRHGLLRAHAARAAPDRHPRRHAAPRPPETGPRR